MDAFDFDAAIDEATEACAKILGIEVCDLSIIQMCTFPCPDKYVASWEGHGEEAYGSTRLDAIQILLAMLRE